jgi:hypothetical protein
MYLRNPSFNNQDMSILKNFFFGESRSRYLQLRLEAFNVFNHTQFSGVNRTTNLNTPPPAGSTTPLTGAGIFNDFGRVSITNNTRPTGSTALLGTFFEYNGRTRSANHSACGEVLFLIHVLLPKPLEKRFCARPE